MALFIVISAQLKMPIDRLQTTRRSPHGDISGEHRPCSAWHRHLMTAREANAVRGITRCDARPSLRTADPSPPRGSVPA
jgi:hypothetical protein